MASNFYMYFVAALIPLVVGAIYYNPKVLGTAWMKACGFEEEDLQGANMPAIFLISYIFGLFLAIALQSIVIHQGGLFSMMAPEILEAGEMRDQFLMLMEQYGDRYRSFGHGATHGTTTALLLAFPIIGTIALFERRGWKYIWIHVGYWFITLGLMGGLLCETLIFEI
ncbi:MAG: DUF1761 domain-containing protein [Saprospiraceae bacterium]|nr:DUF1761 domain-containing protein [Saprospiraceae bacterium]